MQLREEIRILQAKVNALETVIVKVSGKTISELLEEKSEEKKAGE